MTLTDIHGMAKNYQVVRPRERLGLFLRTMYPGVGRDKRLAVDLAVSPRTARNLFEDHWPGDDTFAAIVRRFGDQVWRVLCAPEIGPVLAELEQEEARLARELHDLQRRKAEMAGLTERRSYRPAEMEAEPPGPLNLDLFERMN